MRSNDDDGWGQSFPPKSDVEPGELMEEMTMQDERFAVIEESLNFLGAGMTKEMVRAAVVQVLDVVKNVELKDLSTLPEEQYGRKLYKNLQAMFAHDWGNILRAVVKNNYPLSRFVDKRSAEIAIFNSRLQDGDVDEPIQPLEGYYISLEKTRKSEYLRVKAEERENLSPGSRTREVTAAEEIADKKMLAEIENERHRNFSDDFTRFLEDMKAFQSHVAAKKKLSAKMERTVILSAAVEGLRNAASAITSKLKVAVGLHDRVKMKLCSRVVLEETGETIDNPFENNNLSGMMQLLKAHYFTATLVHFNSDFQRTLGASVSKEDASKNPMKAVNLVEKNIAIWTTMNYWEFMTPDIFWTNLLLRTMPATEFQSKCVEHVVWYITERESGNVRDEKSTRTGRMSKYSMPIYDNLREYIQRFDESNRHKPSSGYNHVPPSPNPNSQYAAGKLRGNVELAHAASANEQFSATVGREREIKCKDVNTGMEFPYTATTEVCSPCFGKSAQCHRPKCYTGMCRKCNLWGHKGDQCRQDLATVKKN